MRTDLLRLGIAGLALAGAFSVQAAKKKSDDLSNMIIQGENRLRVDPKVPPLQWTPAPYRDVQGNLQDYSILGELTPPTIQEPPVVLPSKSASGKPASPWLERVYEPPVLRIEFNPAELATKSTVDWTFLVKDSNGETFYELKGKKDMPSGMEWDGFSAHKEPLRVGYDYAYSFSSVDEAGNPHRFSGKPFRIDAFRYKRGSATVTAFQPETLFEAKSSLKFSKDGVDYLEEVKDSLRRRYDGKVDVVVYEEDGKFAGFRAAALRDWFMKTLDIPEERITAQGFPMSKGGGYRHADVVAK